MKNSVKVGMNKTGLSMAPLMARELMDNEDDLFKPLAQAEEDPLPGQTYEDIRREYLRDSGPVGSLPPPMTAKGIAVTGYEKLTGGRPEVLIDKLGERLAFERSGARLYEAFILKCETQLPDASLDFLREIHAEEIRHFQLLKEAVESLGADPTAVTPCADVAAVNSMGLFQVVNDPRIGIPQSASAILTAELVDNEGWDLLIELTRKAGLTELVEKFEAAKLAEERHLDQMRSWIKDLVWNNDAVQYQ